MNAYEGRWESALFCVENKARGTEGIIARSVIQAKMLLARYLSEDNSINYNAVRDGKICCGDMIYRIEDIILIGKVGPGVSIGVRSLGLTKKLAGVAPTTLSEALDMYQEYSHTLLSPAQVKMMDSLLASIECAQPMIFGALDWGLDCLTRRVLFMDCKPTFGSPKLTPSFAAFSVNKDELKAGFEQVFKEKTGIEAAITISTDEDDVLMAELNADDLSDEKFEKIQDVYSYDDGALVFFVFFDELLADLYGIPRVNENREQTIWAKPYSDSETKVQVRVKYSELGKVHQYIKQNRMPKAKYVLQKTEKSFCPGCGKPVYLLCQDDVKFHPAFYICFDCTFVGQVGIGKVNVVSD